jgi:hypothetical protein
VARFAGTIAQKLVFVRAYAYFLYLHFLINLGVAIWILSMIVHASNTDVVKGCQRLISSGSQSQCTGLLKITTGVFLGVATLLLLLEVCKWPHASTLLALNLTCMSRRGVGRHALHAPPTKQEAWTA